METVISFVLARFVNAWDGIDLIVNWADGHVLAAIFFAYFLRELARYAVKKSPTRYDDLCLDMLEDAFSNAWAKVGEAREKMLKRGK
jgi:hypothetical protein